MPHRTEYKPAKFHFTEKQIHKIKHGEGVRIAHHQIGKGPHVLFLHPHQHHKLSMNHSKGKGMDLAETRGELEHTVNSGAQGTGIWDSIKGFFKTHGSDILNGIAGAASAVAPEFAPAINAARGVVKSATGYGLHHTKHHKHHEHEHYEHEHEHKHHVKPHKRITKHGNGLYL